MTKPHPNSLRIGIIGGGAAGSTLAIRLAEMGVQTTLFEQRHTLVNGPPMCHLHAGGNLYREIPDEDCVALLEQAIDTLKLYPETMDVRPTVFAVPTRDSGTPQALLPRLDTLVAAYQDMIAADASNKVLGEPKNYYRLFSREELESLRQRQQIAIPQNIEQWLIPVAQHLDLDLIKFPVIVVQEYGWNIFRLAASAQLALTNNPNATVKLDTTVTQVTPITQASGSEASTSKTITGWQVSYRDNEGKTITQSFDYLVNACGFRTGIIDDMVGVAVERMVEFKASYITHWQDTGGQWPEVIIHGERGTPHGMAQLTPYPDNYFQIHGMTPDITLFSDGLVAAPDTSAQPTLPSKYVSRIEHHWDAKSLDQRSQNAIDFVSEFIPAFATALPIGKALYGGQQIPGEDVSLRVADMTLYSECRYARCDNVKASSALAASDELVAELHRLALITPQQASIRNFAYSQSVTAECIDVTAIQYAEQRQFPPAMALVNHRVILPQSTDNIQRRTAETTDELAS